MVLDGSRSIELMGSLGGVTLSGCSAKLHNLRRHHMLSMFATIMIAAFEHISVEHAFTF